MWAVLYKGDQKVPQVPGIVQSTYGIEKPEGGQAVRNAILEFANVWFAAPEATSNFTLQEKEEQRTQLVERLWEDFQAESKMGTLDVAAAQAKAGGTKPGDNFAQGVVDNLLHSVKSGFKEAFVKQVKVAGEGKAVE